MAYTRRSRCAASSSRDTRHGASLKGRRHAVLALAARGLWLDLLVREADAREKLAHGAQDIELTHPMIVRRLLEFSDDLTNVRSPPDVRLLAGVRLHRYAA